MRSIYPRFKFWHGMPGAVFIGGFMWLSWYGITMGYKDAVTSQGAPERYADVIVALSTLLIVMLGAIAGWLASQGDWRAHQMHVAEQALDEALSNLDGETEAVAYYKKLWLSVPPEQRKDIERSLGKMPSTPEVDAESSHGGGAPVTMC